MEAFAPLPIISNGEVKTITSSFFAAQIGQVPGRARLRPQPGQAGGSTCSNAGLTESSRSTDSRSSSALKWSKDMV
ncbi:MAG: hypothetical protein OHK0010_04490 [Anaerolineales bacterium]